MMAAATAADVTATPAKALRSPPDPMPLLCSSADRWPTRRTPRRTKAPVPTRKPASAPFDLGQHGELALEGLPGPPQQGLDGADLHAFVVGDLLVGPSGAFPHGQHVTVTDRQAVEGPVDQLAVDGGQNQFVRGFGAR